MNEYMKEAHNEALKNSFLNFEEGGPFGAVIVKDNKIIAKAHNTVLKDNDPTAHAEINVIREACRVLGTNDLSGCILYTSCYPCPMCLSATVWSNIKNIFYGNTKEDAAEIGFRDDYIYKLFNEKGIAEELIVTQIDRDKTIVAFEQFSKNPKLY